MEGDLDVCLRWPVEQSWLAVGVNMCVIYDAIEDNTWLKLALCAICLCAFWSVLWSVLYVQSICLGTLYTCIRHYNTDAWHLIWPWTRRLAIFEQQKPHTFEQWWQFIGHMTYIEGVEWLHVFRRGIVLSGVSWVCVGLYVAGWRFSITMAVVVGAACVSLFLLDTLARLMLRWWHEGDKDAGEKTD